MVFFYFDESIHPRGKFSLGAFVYADSLDGEVASALLQAGLTPRIDEFNSSVQPDRSDDECNRDVTPIIQPNLQCRLRCSS